jgi:hypothetical protein
MTTAALVEILKQNVCSSQELKESFHNESKKVLIKLAEKLGLKKNEYEIRSSMGNKRISGVIVLHTDKLYIQIFQSLNDNMMRYRACNGRKDCSGDAINYIHVQKMLDDDFVANLMTLKWTVV